MEYLAILNFILNIKTKNKKMRKNIVAGNWKMNKNLSEGIQLLKDLNSALEALSPKCEVVVGTPFIHLAKAVETVCSDKIKIAAENCSDKASGAYTGEVSAEMIASTGAKYVILGHSERRSYYGETNSILSDKVNLALANNLIPIFCIGEVKEDREEGKHFSIVENQVKEALFHLSKEEFSHVVLAYEPVWAIGTGLTATAEEAQDIHAHIRKVIESKYGCEIANNTTILYGGSVNASNAKDLFNRPDVDGGLIGGASLSVDKFLPIIEAF